jgi:hypothetical protein
MCKGVDNFKFEKKSFSKHINMGASFEDLVVIDSSLFQFPFRTAFVVTFV